MLTEMDVGLHRELSDSDVVARVLAGDTALFELIMRRYNQRLYRAARSILGDDAEAEDVMQDAYVRAFTHLGQYAGRSQFSTWLTKIAVYESLARKARRRRTDELDAIPGWETLLVHSDKDPEQEAMNSELSGALQAAVDELPEIYRTAFVLREVEGMSVPDISECLGISEENAKVRIHRAKALLRKSLYASFGKTLPGCYAFHLSRCDRVVMAVMQRIGSQEGSASGDAD